MKPWVETGYLDVPEKEFRVSPEEMTPIQKEALCIMCGCCVSECNSMESDPEFFGPAALAKGFRFVGDPRDQSGGRAARALQRRARHLGLHALLLLQRALPKGRRPARRDRQARRRVDQARDRPRHGRQARALVRPLGEDHRLAPGDRARPQDAGHPRRAQGDEVRAHALQARQGSRRPARRRERAGGPGAVRGREGAEARRRRRASSRPSGRSRASSTDGEIPPEAAE